jgi:type 1 fimbria pilin
MKKNFLAAVPLLTVCALASHIAHAATTTDLTISGQIMPSACNISIANNGEWKAGVTGLSQLNATGMTTLPTLGNGNINSGGEGPPNKVSIACNTDTLLAIRTTDNRAGTASGETSAPGNNALGHVNKRFGLGLVNGKPIGAAAFYASYSKVTVDGAQKEVIQSHDSGVTWGGAGFPRALEHHAGYRFSWGDVTPSIAPVAGKDISFDLFTSVMITDKANLPVGQKIPFDGSATLELIYL